MAANKTDFAKELRTWAEKRLGVSSARLQELTAQSDIDGVMDLLRTGPPRARYRIGGFYGGEGHQDTLLMTEDLLVVGPILWEEYAVIEEIGVDVTTAGTEGNLYTALYADRGDGYPGKLIHTSAALGVTVGFKSTGSLAVELPPGLYWGGVVVNQVTTTVATVRSLINTSRFVGETAGANDVDHAGYSMSGQTGAPPTNFGSTAAVVGEVPKLLLKVKSG